MNVTYSSSFPFGASTSLTTHEKCPLIPESHPLYDSEVVRTCLAASTYGISEGCVANSAADSGRAFWKRTDAPCCIQDSSFIKSLTSWPRIHSNPDQAPSTVDIGQTVVLEKDSFTYSKWDVFKRDIYTEIPHQHDLFIQCSLLEGGNIRCSDDDNYSGESISYRSLESCSSDQEKLCTIKEQIVLTRSSGAQKIIRQRTATAEGGRPAAELLKTLMVQPIDDSPSRLLDLGEGLVLTGAGVLLASIAASTIYATRKSSLSLKQRATQVGLLALSCLTLYGGIHFTQKWIYS